MISTIISKLYYSLLALTDDPPIKREALTILIECPEHGPTWLRNARTTYCCDSGSWIPRGRVKSRVPQKIVLLVAMVMLCRSARSAEIFDKSDWVKGAVVIGVKNDGGCVFKSFVKVGDAENNPDDDSPQILGYSPGNIAVDRNGAIVYERVPEEVFIPLNHIKAIHGRLCKCPPFTE